jgi:hypothetical protein
MKLIFYFHFLQKQNLSIMNEEKGAETPNQLKVLTKDERFKKLMLKYEITAFEKLKKLKDFKIAFIFDDSTSMNTSLNFNLC